MKKGIKILYAAAALSCFLSFPALAAETRSEYKEESSSIRSELKALEENMSPLRTENKAVAAKYKAIRLDKKNTGTLSISKENWQQARELHGQIKEIRSNMSGESVKNLRLQAKTALKEKNYDTALQNLEKALEVKQSKQEPMEQINEIWKQIDELLN